MIYNMENFTHKIEEWLHKYGGSPWRFNLKMLSCIDEWNQINYNNLLEIIIKSKGCSICHYSLVPFFIKYLGVDIRCIYKNAVEIQELPQEEYDYMLSMFPLKFKTINSESLLENIGFQELKPVLFKIRKRLIQQEITNIESLEVHGRDIHKIIKFDEEYNS